MEGPWDHPDWYDLHDTDWTAGSEREPEHYREFVLALPPLDRQDHLVDVGAGTGKLAGLIATAYPRLGQVTLIEPLEAKLERAQEKLAQALPDGEIHGLAAGLSEGAALPQSTASLLSIGSVLMPIMELRGGSLSDGLQWLRPALGEVFTMVRPGGWLYDLETTALPWSQGSMSDPVRRLSMPELAAELEAAGFQQVECVYRFRDRVILKGQKPDA